VSEGWNNVARALIDIRRKLTMTMSFPLPALLPQSTAIDSHED